MSATSFGWLRGAGSASDCTKRATCTSPPPRRSPRSESEPRRPGRRGCRRRAARRPPDSRDRFPWLSTDGVALGSLGRSGEGWFDGYALVQALRARARERGAELADRRGGRPRLADGRVVAVTLANGSTHRVRGGRQRRRAVGAPGRGDGRRSTCPSRRGGVPSSCSTPATRRPAARWSSTRRGAWFRPEGGSFITGVAPAGADDLPDLPLEAGPRAVRGRPLAGARDSRSGVRRRSG